MDVQSALNPCLLSSHLHKFPLAKILNSFGLVLSPQICLWPVHTGTKSQVPSHLEVNPCNLNCWEHRSWDLPLHTGPKSYVPSMTWTPTWQHILEVRLFTRVPSPKSQVWHGCLHGNTFWRWGLGPNSQPKSRKLLYIKSRSDFNDDQPYFSGSWGSQVGTLPPCWDLLT